MLQQVNKQWGFNQIIYRNITKITLPITFVNPFIALATPYNDDKDVSGNYLAGFAIRNLTNTDFKINQADVGLSLIHISEPTRQEAISYAVFCLKKKKKKKANILIY